MVKQTVDAFGRIDILVNNAAMFATVPMSRLPFDQLSPEEWDKLMNVNLKGIWLAARAVAPVMRAAKYGKIINISSGTAFKGAPFLMRTVAGRTEQRRHSRKYAEGELPPDRSFYFRGPRQKLNLRAQNLILFLQLADGVDDETWTYHLRQGDYSRWFRERIKDDELAEAAERVEKMADVTPAESRRLIREAVEQNYTAPAPAPLPVPGTDAEPKA